MRYRAIDALRLAPCDVDRTSSTIHRGWLFDMKELTRGCERKAAVGVSVTDTRESGRSRAARRPAGRALDVFDVITVGTALAGDTLRPGPTVAFFWCEQAAAKPSSNPSSRWAE